MSEGFGYVAGQDEPAHRRAYFEDAIRVSGIGPVDISAYPGRLIALEGTDGVGRSTQVALLREYLETQGFGVMHTALARSRLAGAGLRRAKQGTTLGQLTLDLFYATDFADRLENEILPALRAGFVVLTDRYVYSVMARSIARGMSREWLADVYRFAPQPHGVLYLRVNADDLAPRALARGGFDYWESGLDYQEERDVYRSFMRYQRRLLDVFEELVRTYGFEAVDARCGIADVFKNLKDATMRIVGGMKGATA